MLRIQLFQRRCSCRLDGCVTVVLSSDDDEGGDVSQGCSQVRTPAAVEDIVIKAQSSQEAEAKQEASCDVQVRRSAFHM